MESAAYCSINIKIVVPDNFLSQVLELKEKSEFGEKDQLAFRIK